jgi:hypothetical protein
MVEIQRYSGRTEETIKKFELRQLLFEPIVEEKIPEIVEGLLSR